MKRVMVSLLMAMIFMLLCLQVSANEGEQMVTRAGFAAELYMLADVPWQGTGTMPFLDVNQTADYANGVMWCEQMGVIYGVGEGQFEPDKVLTREQMVSMLFRFAGVMGENTSGAVGFEGIADREEISGWAAQALDWALESGLISPDTQGELKPLEPVTASEMQTLLGCFKAWCE